jgi:hypothetical protein
MLASRCWLAGPPGPEVDQRAAHAAARCRGGRGAATLWARQASEKLAGWFSDEFGRRLARTDLAPGVLPRPVTPTLSPLTKRGVPVAILSGWAGLSATTTPGSRWRTTCT